MIGVFDSGVGGLTVLKEITKRLPGEDFIYLGDTARVPYGPKPLDDVKRFVIQISEYLLEQQVKMIVIACNTGTAAGLEDVKKLTKIPVIGVIEPGAKSAVQSTKNKRIGVIGTVGTINSKAYEKSILSFDSEVEVFGQACPPFVDFIERGEVKGNNLIAVIEKYLRPLLEKNVDTIILGCTHYPLIEKQIARIVTSNVKIISSAEETAKEAENRIKNKDNYFNDKNSKNMRYIQGKDIDKIRFLSTADIESFKKLGSRFLGREIKSVEYLQL